MGTRRVTPSRSVLHVGKSCSTTIARRYHRRAAVVCWTYTHCGSVLDMRVCAGASRPEIFTGLGYATLCKNPHRRFIGWEQRLPPTPSFRRPAASNERNSELNTSCGLSSFVLVQFLDTSCSDNCS